MKSTNDAWNMCINHCIVNSWLFRTKLVKGDNSGRYKIINNERELEMLYTQTHRAHFNENHSTSLSGHRGYF